MVMKYWRNRARAASPDNRTGVPYSVSILKLAAGLPLWWRAIPVGRTEAKALVCAEILDKKYHWFIDGFRAIRYLQFAVCGKTLQKTLRDAT